MDGIETQEDMGRAWLLMVGAAACVAAIVIGITTVINAKESRDEAPYRYDQNKSYVSIPGKILKKVAGGEDSEHRNLGYTLSVETPEGVLSVQPWGVSDKLAKNSLDSLVDGDCITINLLDPKIIAAQRYLRLHT